MSAQPDFGPKGWTPDHLASQEGKTFVITGANTGAGFQASRMDDMNWDKNYHANHTYCHSKLAQMMFAYELQKRLTEADKPVRVYVCHPGASTTSLINDKTSAATRIAWSVMSKLPITQSAEKGAYPEVMCATVENLKQEAYYGPSGLMNWVGPVGECKLEPFALDREVATKLWTLSEEQTSLSWTI